jgi:uncharacterized protein YndB with AHSA1/START domain
MLIQDVDRVVRAETVVNAGVNQVWDAWTTNDGIKSFLAPDCNVEIRIDGPYQIFFDPEAEPGLKGADDMIVLAFQPRKMLSFTWNAPTLFPNVRPHRTHVVVRFFSEGDERTRVTLWHDGWGEGEEWDQAFDYFTRAWQQVVMPLLKYRFEHGPLDWNNLPQLDEA